MKKILKHIFIVVNIIAFTSCGSTKQITIEEYMEAGFSHVGPHGIIAFLDYEKGLEYAKTVNKPVLVDFTGLTVVNSRKMELNVWPQGNILQMLKNDVVLISLYVDNRKELPTEAQYISSITGNKIQTIGQKWLDLEQKRYNKDTQPLYVIQDVNGNDLNQFIQYTPDAVAYEKWLQEGIAKFKEKK